MRCFPLKGVVSYIYMVCLFVCCFLENLGMTGVFIIPLVRPTVENSDTTHAIAVTFSLLVAQPQPLYPLKRVTGFL